MDFTVVVMQMNGDITDRQRQTGARLQRQQASRQMAEGFRLMLDEYLPAVVRDIVRFRVPLDEERGVELDWQQPDPASACGTFFLAGQPAVTCLLLSGYDAFRDESCVLAAEDLLAGWCKALKMKLGPGVRSVRDRPLLVCIPWLGVPLDDRQRRRFAVWAVCLASAFFRRAAASADDPARN